MGQIKEHVVGKVLGRPHHQGPGSNKFSYSEMPAVNGLRAASAETFMVFMVSSLRKGHGIQVENFVTDRAHWA